MYVDPRPYGMKAARCKRGEWSKKQSRTASPFVRKIIAAMDASGYTYSYIAEKAGIHRVTISNWKQGGASPLLSDLENVARFLGYEIALQPVEEGR